MALVPYALAWIAMLIVLGAGYALEARRPRSETVGDASLPVSAPSVRLGIVASMLLGPLVAPIWFVLARRKIVGLVLGLAVTAVASLVCMGVYAGARALLSMQVVAAARSACLGDGPIAASPEEVEKEGPCSALYEAYLSGHGCVDGAELVPCTRPAARSFTLPPSPERAKELAEQRCFSRKDLGMCEKLRAADRERVEKQMLAICCTWWQTGPCEAFGSFRDCR